MQLRFQSPVVRTRVRFFLPPLPRRALVLRDAGVALPAAWAGAKVLALPRGEAGKSWRQVEKVLAWLAQRGAERGDSLVVVGGGAALDSGALAAALYRRGMPLVLVPTTLLAMVDAAVGGKTAVNLKSGGRWQKNFAGLFYPAHEVWVSTSFLETLPKRERLSGAGECWKTLWIGGRRRAPEALLDFVATGRVSPALQALVRFCLREKIRVVQKDPLDRLRVRELLNFGHTVGHALEALGRGRLSHGECVLWGMAVESRLGRKSMAVEADAALRSLGLRLPREFLRSEREWCQAFGADKKMAKGLLEMSVLAEPGRPKRVRMAPLALAKMVKEFPKSYQP